jgi:gamma-glutamylcysteine synthetase
MRSMQLSWTKIEEILQVDSDRENRKRIVRELLRGASRRLTQVGAEPSTEDAWRLLEGPPGKAAARLSALRLA